MSGITRVGGSAALACAMFAISASAHAHHSNSAYQVDEIITLTGTVKEWRWSNPHTWLFLTVENADGAAQEWAVEGRAPLEPFGIRSTYSSIVGRRQSSGTFRRSGPRRPSRRANFNA